MAARQLSRFAERLGQPPDQFRQEVIDLGGRCDGSRRRAPWLARGPAQASLTWQPSGIGTADFLLDVPPAMLGL